MDLGRGTGGPRSPPVPDRRFPAREVQGRMGADVERQRRPPGGESGSATWPSRPGAGPVDRSDSPGGSLTMTTATPIRPALQSLRQLPTLHQVSEAWGRLELKLETDDTRYWITTEVVPQKTSGTPINYVVNYVTVEKLSEDGNWDLKAVYSPEAWRLSQG